jgi:hypothetical protein
MLFVGLNAAAQIFPVKMTLQIPEELSSACFQDFYPIGFSDPALTEGSYFAFFLYKNFSGGLGEHTDFRFYIQDLITDDLVVSYEFRSNRADFTLDILEPAEEALLRKQASEVYALDPLHVWGALAKPYSRGPRPVRDPIESSTGIRAFSFSMGRRTLFASHRNLFPDRGFLWRLLGGLI